MPAPPFHCPHRCSWQQIWAFFMQAPAARDWLFQPQPPPISHTVNALRSNPLLVGFIFGDVDHRQTYSYPDIGDLHCIHSTFGDAILGFHYGYQNIQPLIPMLYQVSQDPILKNPKVTARRSIKQRSPFPDTDCYFAIEFSWLQSGVLSVATNIYPTSSPSHLQPTTPDAYLNYANNRIFSPSTAKRLMAIHQRYSSAPYSPHSALPSDFLDPPDDCYNLSITEPEMTAHSVALAQTQLNTTPRAKFTVEEHFQPSAIQNARSPVSKRPRASSSTITTPLSLDALQLWDTYAQKTAQSRRNGIYNTVLTKRFGGADAKFISLYARSTNYTLLSTMGLNTHGRIQRLCSQLGIHVPSPMLDTMLQNVYQDVDVGQVFDSDSAFYQDGQGIRLFDTAVQPNHQLLCEYNQSDDIPCNEALQHLFQVSNPGTNNTLVPTTTSAYRVQLGRNEPSDVPPACNQTDIVELDASEPIPLITHNPSVSFTTEQESIPSRGTRQRSTVRLPKRKRHSISVSALPSAPANTTHLLNPSELTETQDQHNPWVHNNAPRQVAVQPTSSLPPRPPRTMVSNRRNNSIASAHIPFSEHKTGSSSISTRVAASVSGVNIPPDDCETKTVELASSSATVLESEHLTGGASSRTDTTTAGSSSTKEKSNTVWVCDRCGVLIRGKKGNLNRHIANKHDKIRNFECTEPNCGRKFQTRLNLVRHHTAVHLGRPFACSECPRTFKYENDLVLHVQSAHDNTSAKLECEVCRCCFARRSTLNRHMTKVHKMMLENS